MASSREVPVFRNFGRSRKEGREGARACERGETGPRGANIGGIVCCFFLENEREKENVKTDGSGRHQHEQLSALSPCCCRASPSPGGMRKRVRGGAVGRAEWMPSRTYMMGMRWRNCACGMGKSVGEGSKGCRPSRKGSWCAVRVWRGRLNGDVRVPRVRLR